MAKHTIISKATLPSALQCNVYYHQQKDTVELELGGTTIKIGADSFIVMQEVMRKAVAKIIMRSPMKPTNCN